METTYNERQASLKSRGRLVITYLITLALSIISSFLMHNTWIKYQQVYHTVLELICVFIAMSIFFSVWYNYKRSSTSSYLLGFGFLIVAAFDALHTFYFLKLNLTVNSYFDLSTRYWVYGRIVQAIVIFFAVKDLRKSIRVNKFVGLALTILIIAATNYVSIAYHDYLPVLLTESGITPIKIATEYVVIIICFCSLILARNKINEDESIGYHYIVLSLCMMIPSELLFTLYSQVTSVIWTIGHVFKIVSYYFLFRGIFASSIIYPYDRLEAKNIELEKANREVNKATDMLADILDALPIAVYTYGKDGNVKYVNKKFEELFECDRDKVIGLTTTQTLELFPRLEENEELLPEMVLGGINEIYKTIRTYKVGSGQYKKMSITTNRIRSGAISLIREAKEEQELNNLHLQTETILNSVSNCILMIDNSKKIILCNRALEEVFEVNRDDILGMHIDEFNRMVQFDIKELPDIALSEYIDTHFYGASFTSISGNKKELDMYVSNIKNVNGEVIGAISVSTDVTELKKEQARIQQQEKLALLGQLGAGIVHETRNFLTTIKGRCQLIDVVSTEASVKEYASKINKDVDEVNRIISEFLFLSKPRETELAETSMYDVFQSIKNIVETSSLVKGVNVCMKISKEERYLMCDEIQIKQVILNICKNAVDAMAGISNPELTVETGYEEKLNEMFIRIEDNGKGMTEEQLSKIGTMFYTTKKTGTGLGLNLCYQIIKEHNGRIEVQSEINKGTTFNIVLPCIEDDEMEEAI
jgi:PAS domain S-box-containing protein